MKAPVSRHQNTGNDVYSVENLLGGDPPDYQEIIPPTLEMLPTLTAQTLSLVVLQ